MRLLDCRKTEVVEDDLDLLLGSQLTTTSPKFLVRVSKKNKASFLAFNRGAERTHGSGRAPENRLQILRQGSQYDLVARRHLLG